MFQTIEQCIAYIEQQIPQKIDLSLDRIQAAAKLLGNPQDTYPTIHITGTNGKGSTSAFTTQLLASQNLRVGLFTSPHLMTYNERIRINESMISDRDFIFLIDVIITDVIPHIQLTIFECLTLVGYLYFANQNVDVAVIEVGLGGRYDATNIITPKIACVTNVSIDHVHFLSDNIMHIAHEKVGIFKAESINIHTVDNPLLQEIFQEGTHIDSFINYQPTENGFAIQFQVDQFVYRGDFPMYGVHQIRNLEAALKIVFTYLNLVNRPLLREQLSEQIQHLQWRGRMENLAHNIYFDGAHNVAGIYALVNTVATHFHDCLKPVRVIFSVMRDKDVTEMIKILEQSDVIDHVYFLPLSFDRALQVLPNDVVSSSKISEISFSDLHLLIKDNVITIFAGTLYGYGKIKELI